MVPLSMGKYFINNQKKEIVMVKQSIEDRAQQMQEAAFSSWPLSAQEDYFQAMGVIENWVDYHQLGLETFLGGGGTIEVGSDELALVINALLTKLQ